jgi:RHS repeat-associated protein
LGNAFSTHNSLLRLTKAETTAWDQSFAYDGWGNLLTKSSTKGSVPTMSLNVDPGTNRVTSTGFQYDANGKDISRTTPNDPLKTFDVANRLATVNGFSYGYTADNRRVLKRNDSTGEEIYTFWSITGQRLGAYKLNVAGDTWTTLSTNVYFHGRLIQSGALGNMQAVLTDRLGSNVTGGKRYFPYGEERGAGTANNDEKFATYYRDSESGLDYADQRYEAVGYGRFSSPDRVMTEAQPAQPNSWNGYAYTSGDPVNSSDPTGRFFCNTYGAWDWGGQPWWCDPSSGPTFFCPAGFAPSPGGACYILAQEGLVFRVQAFLDDLENALVPKLDEWSKCIDAAEKKKTDTLQAIGSGPPVDPKTLAIVTGAPDIVLILDQLSSPISWAKFLIRVGATTIATAGAHIYEKVRGWEIQTGWTLKDWAYARDAAYDTYRQEYLECIRKFLGGK